MVTPRASVIIATYNYSSVLPYSIGSVLDQTVEDIEVLVVGDGCTDDSEKVVAEIGDPRVRWMNLDERGGHQSWPNNRGLKEARAPFVFYLGHDDLWLPKHVELLLEQLEGGADMAHGLSYRVAEDGSGKIVPTALRFQPGIPLPPTAFAHRLDLVGRHGGWADYRVSASMPEFDLVSRYVRAGARMESVLRVTSVKLPAAVRKDVYSDKPNHEQAHWLKKIRSKDDLEARLLESALQEISRELEQIPVREDVIRVAKRLRNRLKRRLFPAKSPRSRISANKKFKGSD